MAFTLTNLLLAIASLANINCKPTPNSQINSTLADTVQSIHQFQVPALTGGVINFADFAGKKILIVNTASKCGFTPQYKELQQLADTYKDKLVVVGFPSNDFLGQEPGSNEDIAAFCQKNYGVTFPMAAKVSVKGKDAAPIYQWLTTKNQNGVLDAKITWNFNKFLLDEKGVIIEKFDSKTSPMDTAITSKL